jgi:hypothetical protein
MAIVLLGIWASPVRITQQAIRRGSFRSVKELVERIDQYVRASNTHAHPFTWTATAIPSSPKSSDYVNVFPGRYTRSLLKTLGLLQLL